MGRMPVLLGGVLHGDVRADGGIATMRGADRRGQWLAGRPISCVDLGSPASPFPAISWCPAAQFGTLLQAGNNLRPGSQRCRCLQTHRRPVGHAPREPCYRRVLRSRVLARTLKHLRAMFPLFADFSVILD